MNNKNPFSIRAAAFKILVAIRKKLNLRPKSTMAEVARRSGLPVEDLKNMPANFAGFLDWHPDPRFIAVNRDLPAHERAWFIARQLAWRAQQQRDNSLALDRPWKWQMFDAAPAGLKEKISQMDVEYRAHWLMLFWSTGDEFRAYVRMNLQKALWTIPATDNIVRYHLSKLRVKLWLA
jgi:hypothetical protein